MPSTGDTWAPGPSGPALTVDPDRLQQLAQRNLWMHFTRMGSFDEHHSVPVIVRGEGCYVYDEHGKRYLDGLSALYCVNVGPRPRRARRGGRRPRPSSSASTPTGATRTRPRSNSRRASPGWRPGNLNRVFFTSGGSEAVESAWKLAKAYHRAHGRHEPPQAGLAQPRLPRRLDGRADRDGPAAAARAVRAADARAACTCPNTNSYRWKEDRDPLWAADAIEEAIEFEGAGHRRRGDPRAGPERRRLLHAPGGLLPARARDLRPPRRAADLRRGDLLVGPPRALVRLRTLRLPARHDHDRQGHQLGLRAARRGDRRRPHRRALPARQGVLHPRLHLRRASRRLRGRPREHRPDRARGPARERPRQRGRCSARCSTGCATCRSSATCAAPATSTRSSWSRTRRPRRPSTTRSPSTCCAASSRASSTGAG